MVDAKVVASLQLILLCVIIELNLNIYIDHHTNILQVRILVTHGIGFLPQCDVIVVMADGQITEVGTYTELIDNDGDFAQFLHTYKGVDKDDEENPGNQILGNVAY